MGDTYSRNYLSNIVECKWMTISENKALQIIQHMCQYTDDINSETKIMINLYDGLSLENISDSDIFSELCWVIYTSGFKYDIIKKYWPTIRESYCFFDVNKVASFLSDIEYFSKKICEISGFNNLKKANWCIQNAKRIIELNDENENYSGLKGYLINLSMKKPVEIIEQVPIIVDYLQFKGIGQINIFHLLKNVGIKIFKPDIHVRRLLYNIGLINDNNKSLRDIYNAMQYLSYCTGLDIIVLDTILFNYGRFAGDFIDLECLR